ncbi:hypothetical protein E4U60_002116 [Claviceps pazoutovae]|uniref:Uncharacterized protein n=1 Tax=Claviceps pazoutovae TaxID=1649127 RepID=A0A9P7SHE8_9HYPO|nr:hypothetical protein E4U60_002116 [Claviceps pazoutovae]
MNGDQSAEPEKPPPPDAIDGSSFNGADALAKKRKKDNLKPIITTEGSESENDAQSAKRDQKADPGLSTICAAASTIHHDSWALLCAKCLGARKV